MKQFYIITNSVKDKDFKVTGEIEKYLTANGSSCVVTECMPGGETDSFRYTNPELIPEGCECIIVLGGDGTLLQAARDVVHTGIPLFGINMGTLGFLAEVDQQSIFPALDQLMADEYLIEERMMFTGRIMRKGKILGSDIALNDIVISRAGQQQHIMKFINYVNNEYLNSYNADGIIISTPTGSTGYSLSAGGPIISPGAEMTLMTPLAPHTLNSRSIIFSPSDCIAVEIAEGRPGITQEGQVAFDGFAAVPLTTGDQVIIEEAKVKTKIIKLSKRSFIEVLRLKMSNS